MPVTIGVDVGTTTITALALEAERGEVVCHATLPNDGEITAPEAAAIGRSEWDARRMVGRAIETIAAVARGLGPRRKEVAGIGLTGQQHGVVLVQAGGAPAGPFIGWKDRRGLERVRGGEETFVARAERRRGPAAHAGAGCALAAGFMGVTLFWLRESGALPSAGAACFITDYLGSMLTGEAPVTDPTMGASSGLFRLAERRWDPEMLRALGLPPALFPEVREAGERFGVLTATAARAAGLPAGVPVCVGLGDHQASFLGSVADRDAAIQVNVGTGAQVARYTDAVRPAPPLETRPFPRAGYLLVEAGLCGGRSYATLRRFFRETAACLLDAPGERDLYAAMNRLAGAAPRGAAGLRCEPYFTGTRAQPERRGAWLNVSEENFTPANLVRALLEGMARAFREASMRIEAATGLPCGRLVGAGNGLRENPALAGIIAEEFGLPLSVSAHREEAAYGAALTASVGVGILPDLAAAGRRIRYQSR